MSARYPGHNPNPFSGTELGGMDLPADEIAADAQLARHLEAIADRGTVRPSPDFADRVMAAIATEPTPAPVVAAGSALRRRSLLGLVASVRDAARITFGHGFPAVARAQALAVVLVTSLTLGAAAVGTAGALGVFNGQNSTPAPSVAPTPSVVPSPSPEPSTSPQPTDTTGPVDSSVAPDATGTPEPSESPEEPSESPEPTEVPQPTEGHSGSDSGSGGTGTSGGDNPTPRPTATPRETHSAQPSEDGGEHGSTPQPSFVMPGGSPTSEPH
jgi:hypothetical protein